MTKELTFDINQFGNNLVHTGQMAVAMHIYNLLKMQPGTDVYNPEKGADLNSYRGQVADTNVLSLLQTTIHNQVNTYTPYNLASLACDIIDDQLVIVMEIVGFSDLICFKDSYESTVLQLLKND